jgi:hypothetical protein
MPEAYRVERPAEPAGGPGPGLARTGPGPGGARRDAKKASRGAALPPPLARGGCEPAGRGGLVGLAGRATPVSRGQAHIPPPAVAGGSGRDARAAW